MTEKIFICDFDNSNGQKLESFLTQSGFKNVIFQPDFTEVKESINSYKPDVIISGNHLWENPTGINFITKVPAARNSQIIIWTDKIPKITELEIIKKNNLRFIKKTGNEKELIKTLLG